MKLFGFAQRRARLAALAATALMLCAPIAAFAETDAKLPKGYTSDELPALPAPEGNVAPVSGDANSSNTDEYTDTDPSALSDFQQPLAPYGEWVEDDTYGTVWVPHSDQVGDDFAPYQTAGHWEQTDQGEWLWASYYDWGYIPFHYGRWVWVQDLGWAWIPGRTYAPAWVVWRTGHYGYIGWAPMPPAYYWHDGFAVSLWVIPPAAYVFCATPYIYHHHVHHHVIRDPGTVRVAASKTRHYVGAQPASGRSYKPAQPTPADGGVSPRSAKLAKGEADPRARALSRRSTTPKAPASKRGSRFQPKAGPGAASSARARDSRTPDSRAPGTFHYAPNRPAKPGQAHRLPGSRPSVPRAQAPAHRFPRSPAAAPSRSGQRAQPPRQNPPKANPSTPSRPPPRSRAPQRKKKTPAAAPPPPQKRKVRAPARSSPPVTAPQRPSRPSTPRSPERAPRRK